MQLLRAADPFVRHIAGDRFDPVEGDVERLEDLRHLLADDVERAFDALVREREARSVGADCEIGEQRRRHQDCRHQHPSQQTNGAWVVRFHLSPVPDDRSDPGARLASSFARLWSRVPSHARAASGRDAMVIGHLRPAPAFGERFRTHRMVGYKCRRFKAPARCSAAGMWLAHRRMAENFETSATPDRPAVGAMNGVSSPRSPCDRDGLDRGSFDRDGFAPDDFG